MAATGFGGGYAEYISVPDSDMVGRVVIEVAKKPSNLTFEEAATVPIGGMTALAFLRKANVKNGQKVLVYGAWEALAPTLFSLLNIRGRSYRCVSCFKFGVSQVFGGGCCD